MKRIYLFLIFSFIILLNGCSMLNKKNIETEEMIGIWKSGYDTIEFTVDGKLNFSRFQEGVVDISVQYDYEFLYGKNNSFYLKTSNCSGEGCDMGFVAEYSEIDIVDNKLHFPGFVNVFEKN